MSYALHPNGLPDLFLDRSLGRHMVPSALRAAGLRLTTLAERSCSLEPGVLRIRSYPMSRERSRKHGFK